ncbi:MAG: hypothetical protein WAQ52_00455 [Terriglobales bacterium]
MRQSVLSLLLIVASAVLMQAQAGPCTESLIKQGKVPVAEDAFSYMPPYGKPVVGKSEIQATNQEKFGERTNIKSSYVGEHRIVSSSSGDMAFEHGTLQVSYDDKGNGKHHEFKAVILNVYKAKDGVCQKVAGTMQPLEE